MYWNHSCICMLNRIRLHVVAYCVKKDQMFGISGFIDGALSSPVCEAEPHTGCG